jgi:hypothetical protein
MSGVDCNSGWKVTFDVLPGYFTWVGWDAGLGHANVEKQTIDLASKQAFLGDQVKFTWLNMEQNVHVLDVPSDTMSTTLLCNSDDFGQREVQATSFGGNATFTFNQTGPIYFTSTTLDNYNNPYHGPACSNGWVTAFDVQRAPTMELTWDGPVSKPYATGLNVVSYTIG